MKKLRNILILISVCLVTSSNAQKIQKEHFTTIDKLFYVELGMTSVEVQTTLGVDPFDFYQNLSESEMIVEYRYLHKKLEVRANDNNYVKTKGEDYYTDASSIYCTYDKEGKLVAYYTDSGNANSEDAYIWENTIKQYNTNPDCSNTCVIVIEKNDKVSNEIIDETEKKDTKKKSRFSRK
jgi:hypothetical protein